MRPRFAFLPSFLSCLFIPALSASGLDIAGMILDKLKRPIPLADICLRNNPSLCVKSDSNGSFRIMDGTGAGFAPARIPIVLELTGGRLALTVPAATSARIDWHDARGRSLAPARMARLASGRNLLEIPAPLLGGLNFLRISMPGRTISWKAVLLAPGEAHTNPGGSGRAWSALSKPSAVPSDLVVTKEGFRPETYRPRQEVETGVTIVLTALSDSGFKYTSVFKSKNVALDRAKGERITEATVDTCQGATPVKTLVRDTSRFAVRDGKLLLWKEGQCVGEILTGGGADVAGTWSFSESDVLLPEDLRPAGCKDTLPSRPVPETVTGTLAISESEQTLELTVEVCPPDIYLPLIDQFVKLDSTIALIANSCRRLVFRSGAGEEATLDFEKRGDSLASTFTHKDSICKAVEDMRAGEGVVPDCTGNDPALDFLECVAGTGFFGDAPPGSARPPGRSFIYSRHGRIHPQPR